MIKLSKKAKNKWKQLHRNKKSFDFVSILRICVFAHSFFVGHYDCYFFFFFLCKNPWPLTLFFVIVLFRNVSRCKCALKTCMIRIIISEHFNTKYSYLLMALFIKKFAIEKSSLWICQNKKTWMYLFKNICTKEITQVRYLVSW